MGNYPYASSYLLHGQSLLPPWPVRAACAHLEGIDMNDDRTLFVAVRKAAATLHNSTKDLPCFDITRQTGGDPHSAGRSGAAHQRAKMTSPLSAAPSLQGRSGGDAAPRGGPRGGVTSLCSGSWGYQWCTEMTQPFTQGTADDIFFCANGTFYAKQNCSHWDLPANIANCIDQWGVAPRPEWARVALGGKRTASASNIVFSNGLLDPWHGGGVLTNQSDSVLAVLIPNGAVSSSSKQGVSSE